MLRATFQTGQDELRAPNSGNIEHEAKRLLALRNELAAEEELLAKRRLALARAYADGTDLVGDTKEVGDAPDDPAR